MIPPPNCYLRRCKHYQGVKYLGENEADGEVPSCKAFPDGIPEEIAYGPNKHLEPVPGDKGVVFEEAD